MKIKITMVLAFLMGLYANANNITVSNISLENLNEGANWVQVEFDISWENSWRISAGPSNWDAAWVFIKYRVNSGEWAHAQLAQIDNVAASGSTIDVYNDNIGAFIYRDSDGSGDLILQDTRLRWNYGAIDTNDIIDVQVFAIEMVYVPEGAFYVGGTSGDEVGKFHVGGNTQASYQITSENSIVISNTSGNLFYDNTTAGSNSGDQLGPIPGTFPKGFSAFYCMKYEVSQGQWVSFFNTLTDTQKAANDVTGPNGKNTDNEATRNTISWLDGAVNATTTTPDLPLNFVFAVGTLSYLDWAGLRPMTELEYEKSCRGPILPKAGEFAWGNANIASTIYTYLNIDSSDELITNPETGVGNVIYSGTNGTPSGPKRCGILAASSINKTREESGGSYYGIMELSGNLYERCITVGLPVGRTFSANHGNGTLALVGNNDVSTWPTTAAGIGYKGAGYPNGSAFLRVSDRYDAANEIANGNGRLGFRGVRSQD